MRPRRPRSGRHTFADRSEAAFRFVGAIRDPKVQRMLLEQSMEPLGASVEEINKAMKMQLEAARVVYKDFNLKPNE